MNFGKSLIGTIAATLTLFSTVILAAEHIVTAKVTSFKPTVIRISIGDTVSWDKMSGHTTETIQGMIPQDAKGWMSAISENFTTPPLTVEGIYFYKCTPHWGAGMGGVVIVGEPTNLASIEGTKPRGAAKRLLKKTKKALK
ncbi:MAG: copper-binding protein [Piscirickettsiaceae bacterium]|nr:copper-binding protein [Piscirickettsiaceae bacterium]